jgi:exopolyphosphatase/guanosine-5'-triphosphate,3'-diphosphate pyrophosphatase
VTIAAIDIGTNSFHLVVARAIGEAYEFEVLSREKEMVRLGAGSTNGASDMRELQPEAIERGIRTLIRFRQIAEIHDAHIIAVATSAVREAENAHVFVERAAEEAGVDVDVITGTEEARLIHLGILQSVPVFDKRLVLIDIGGGSTEVLVGEHGEVLTAGSVKLGSLRLTRRFFRGESLHPAAVDSCRRHIRSSLAPMVRQVRRLGFEVAVGSSGTIEAVAALAQARREGEPPRSYNNIAYSAAEVAVVVERLIGADTVEARRKLPGMESSRADIILAGALILDEAMRELRIDRIVISDYALREGLLLDALERARGSSRHHLHDLRRRSVLHLAELMDDDPGHSEEVARLALELFDATARLGLHHLSEESRELLEAAALLANVGMFVSHDKHHKHSYYVIRNSDQLAGFTDHEIERIALVARYHRKSEPKTSHREYSSLSTWHQDEVRVLAGLLRVAVSLDRAHAGLVDDLVVTDDGTTLTIALEPFDADADLNLELYTANDRKGLLEEVLGRAVDIVVA